MHRLRNFIIMIIAIGAIFMARSLSKPLMAGDNYQFAIEDEEVILVGNFSNGVNVDNREEKVKNENEVKYFLNGVIPFIMYLLSLLCLLDLIKNTYLKFMKERNLVFKTALLLIMLLQIILIGLISFYVADISLKILILWLLIALILTGIVYEGTYFIDLIKISTKR